MEGRRGQRREEEKDDEKLFGRDESGEMALIRVDGQVRAGTGRYTTVCAVWCRRSHPWHPSGYNGTPEERGQQTLPRGDLLIGVCLVG